MSKRVKLLMAIYGMGSRPFTLAEMCVAAWESDRAAWGMQGYEMQYPDNKRIEVTFYGQGFVARGIVRKLDESRWTMTEEGANIARKSMERNQCSF